MLLYLGHTHPDIAFAVFQSTRYTFEPKQSHKAALKRIWCYLKETADKGLILDFEINSLPLFLNKHIGYLGVFKLYFPNEQAKQSL